MSIGVDTVVENQLDSEYTISVGKALTSLAEARGIMLQVTEVEISCK